MNIGRSVRWHRRSRVLESAPAFGAKFLTCILLLGCALPAGAISPSAALSDFSHQSWNMENGLPQNRVQALAQTSDGFVWLGTEAGLVRFDGFEFMALGRDSVSGLPGNDIRCLSASADGTLWIGTNAGLAQWRAGRLTVLAQRDSAPGHVIRGLAQSGDGLLWVLTEIGLTELGARGPVAVRSPFADSLITNIAADGMGGVWAIAQNRMAIYRGGRWKVPSGAGPQEQIRFVESSGRGLTASAGGNKRQEETYVAASDVAAQFALGKDIPTGRIQTM